MNLIEMIFGKKNKVSDNDVPEVEINPTITNSEFNYFIKNDLKVSYKLGIGDRVIIVSNEPNGVSCGTLIGFEEITKAKNIVPLVQEDDGETFMVMGTLLPFDQEMYDILLPLSTDHSAWNYISPSWVQLTDSTVYRSQEDSIVLKNLK
tara:strand:+ start:1087 stop:1533 length:447 start_codon:yes stop_codon:yes gene_type:complete